MVLRLVAQCLLCDPGHRFEGTSREMTVHQRDVHGWDPLSWPPPWPVRKRAAEQT